MNLHILRTSTIITGLIAGLLYGFVSTASAEQPGKQTAKSAGVNSSRYMRDYPKQLLEVQPPWNKPLYQGTELTVPGLQNVPDIHGDVNNPQLVVFFAGNQYMLVNRLMRAFSKAYPKYPRVVAFTMPPGRLITSINRGNGILIGNMRITLKPDILTAGHGSIMRIQKKYNWFASTEVYARNRLAIMVYKGNPKNVTGMKSLAQNDIQLCMPNPEWEGIAKHAIIPALKKTGGDALVNTIYKKKVNAGTTFLTHIHHRQTPVRIMERKCTAGVVWYTEAYFHAKIKHHPISIVTVPKQNNKVVGYTAALMRSAPNAKAGRAFMKFLMGAESQKIYQQYGFMAPKK